MGTMKSGQVRYLFYLLFTLAARSIIATQEEGKVQQWKASFVEPSEDDCFKVTPKKQAVNATRDKKGKS